MIGPYQVQSTITYSQPISAARSVKYFMVAVFIPTLKSAAGAQSPLHQRSQAERPGLIHEVSLELERCREIGHEVRLDEPARVGPRSSAPARASGEGVFPTTATPGSSGRGESVETSVFAAAPWPARYIPAQSRRSDSVIATKASSPARTASGRPTIDPAVIAPSVVSSNSFSWEVV